MLLSAFTFDELHERLPDLNTQVPPRPAPRKTPAELYSVVRLLGSVPLAPIDFPLHLVKGERPDFSLQLGARAIGIEHTEAVPQNVAHENVLRAGLGHDFYMMRNAVPCESRKSKKQLLAEIKENRMPPPMIGDSVERGWAEAMVHFVENKAASASKPGYAAHDENWLVIYDNWPAPALQHQLALALLQERLEVGAAFAVFERIFILDENVLVDLGRGHALFHSVKHSQRP
jgi:hypothetical protein